MFDRLVGLFVGLGVYLVIPLRAQAQPPVNWGNAANWDGFIWLVSGKMYWGRLLDFGGGYLLAGLRAWSHLLLQQLSILGVVPVFLVLAVLFKRSRIYVLTAWLVLAYSAFAILFYSPDSYVYLIPALIALSVWIGLGCRWLIEQVRQTYGQLGPIAAACIAALFVGRALLGIPGMDLSADRSAERYAQSILSSAPPGAIIFTTGDEATFSLWYAHYAYGHRPDAAVISSDLLIQPWYHDVLKYTYPDLIVGEMAQEKEIIRANPRRPACRAGPGLQQSSRCLPYYYVDGQSGSDANPGTQTQPWKTIQKCLDVVQPGDTCDIIGGTYNEALTLQDQRVFSCRDYA